MHNLQDEETYEDTKISVEDGLRKEILKASRTQANNKLNEPIDCFELLNQPKNLKNLEAE